MQVITQPKESFISLYIYININIYKIKLNIIISSCADIGDIEFQQRGDEWSDILKQPDVSHRGQRVSQREDARREGVGPRQQPEHRRHPRTNVDGSDHPELEDVDGG